MNRAFVNEDSDQGVVFIPPRAPLPPGVINYVTPKGYQLLKEELVELNKEKSRVQTARKMADLEKVRLLTILRGRQADLKARISSAKVIKPSAQTAEEIRFGASVAMTGGTGRSLTIVGVDEADAERGLIAFVAPVARALMGKVIGDQVDLPSPSGPHTVEIVEIMYG